MKKIVLLGLLMITSAVKSQIKVEDTEKFQVVGEYKLLGKSYEKISKLDGVYVFAYRVEKFTTTDNYKSFAFRDSDLETLYSLFSDFTDKKKDDSKTVTLETGDTLVFNYNKTLGSMYAEVYHTDKAGVTGKLRWLNQKQIKLLIFLMINLLLQYMREILQGCFTNLFLIK